MKQNTRIFIAFTLAILVYALLIFVYIKNFSKIEIPSKKSDTHIVKLNLVDLPEPTVKRPPNVESSPPKPPVNKPIKQTFEQKSEKKEIKKEKPKVVKKKNLEKKAVKKVIEKKKIEKKVIKPKVVTKKSESLKKFEEEMVYIPNATITPTAKVQKEADDLGSFLATPSSPSSLQSYPSNKVRQLYGTEYLQFTATQKKFIKDNLDEIQKITQRTLTRRGYPRGAGETGQEGTNIVSFNLHPNGDISNLRLKSGTGYRALDENSVTLIKVAYKDYPYPSTTTKIVFHVHYSIYGY